MHDRGNLLYHSFTPLLPVCEWCGLHTAMAWCAACNDMLMGWDSVYVAPDPSVRHRVKAAAKAANGGTGASHGATSDGAAGHIPHSGDAGTTSESASLGPLTRRNKLRMASGGFCSPFCFQEHHTALQVRAVEEEERERQRQAAQRGNGSATGNGSDSDHDDGAGHSGTARSGASESARSSATGTTGAGTTTGTASSSSTASGGKPPSRAGSALGSRNGVKPHTTLTMSELRRRQTTRTHAASWLDCAGAPPVMAAPLAVAGAHLHTLMTTCVFARPIMFAAAAMAEITARGRYRKKAVRRPNQWQVFRQAQARAARLGFTGNANTFVSLELLSLLATRASAAGADAARVDSEARYRVIRRVRYRVRRNRAATAIQLVRARPGWDDVPRVLNPCVGGGCRCVLVWVCLLHV